MKTIIDRAHSPMKFIALLILLLACPAFAQNKNKNPAPVHTPIKPAYRYVNPNGIPNTDSTPNAGATTSTTQTEDSPESGHLGFTISSTGAGAPHMVDPYRVINGRTNIVGTGWILFSGTVIGGDPNGIVLSGSYTTVPKSNEVYNGEFFVANYPDLCVLNDVIGSPTRWFYAWPAGLYTYTNTIGGVQTMHKLDYGLPWTPSPPTLKQLVARAKLKMEAKAAEDAKKNAITARVVKDNQESADRGEVIGLLRMGERYRDGDGVERDLAKAREYLQRASAQGSLSAQSELEQLK